MALKGILWTCVGGTLLLASCASTGLRCDRASTGADLISLLYESGGPVGIVQRLSYAEEGVLVLEATNWNTYCASVGADGAAKLSELLESPEVEEDLRGFGSILRYEECFIQETLTVRINERKRKARIDALRGSFLDVARLLEEMAEQQFGDLYSVRVVERATQRQCEGGHNKSL